VMLLLFHFVGNALPTSGVERAIVGVSGPGKVLDGQWAAEAAPADGRDCWPARDHPYAARGPEGHSPWRSPSR